MWRVAQRERDRSTHHTGRVRESIVEARPAGVQPAAMDDRPRRVPHHPTAVQQPGATAVVLFADRANPTSTGVYRRLGFDPVCDHDDWGLEY